MLRRYFLLMLLPFVAACSQSDDLPNVTPHIIYHKVPNLINDTLVSTTQAGNAFVYDTLYTATDSTDCYIYYKGNVYKLKAYEEPGKGFSDSTGTYLCDLFDINGTMLNSGTKPVKVNTAMAYNTLYKILEKRRQSVEINIAPFPQDAGIYFGRE